MTKKSKLIKLITLLVLLLLVIVAYFIVGKVNKEKQEKEEKSSKADVITINSTDTNKISSFSYTYQDVEYKFYKENDTWHCSNDNTVELDQDKVKELASQFNQVTASRIVEEQASDLSQYGLEQPANVIQVTDTDGSTITYDIGNENKVVNGYYLKTADKSTVYLTDTFPTYFSKSLNDLKKVEEDSIDTNQATDQN